MDNAHLNIAYLEMNLTTKVRFKVDGYTIRRSSSVIFMFASLLVGVFLKDNLLHQEQSLSYESRPLLEGFYFQGSEQEVTKNVPLHKNGR